MRTIYVDEAGTSQHEKVRVVVGLSISSNAQRIKALKLMERMFNDFVPKEIRENYVFHGKEVFSGGKYRDIWSFTSRIHLMQLISAIPRICKIPIHIGVTHPINIPEINFSKSGRFNESVFDHINAFMFMMTSAIRDMESSTPPEEVAHMIHEKIPDRQKFLEGWFEIMKDDKFIDQFNECLSSLGIKTLLPTKQKFIDSPAFSSPLQAPILQLADACAFSFRRYLTDGKYGDLLLYQMTQQEQLGDEWRSGAFSTTFNWKV